MALDSSLAASPKPIVNSWDVFDTLLARFIDAGSIFATVEARHGAGSFVERRLAAQAELDKIGKPYVIYAIYDVMVQQGLSREMARRFLHDEITIERENLIPIRRNVMGVRPTDLIVSDMYLPPELISSLLFDVCEMQAHLPIVGSNWGKHTGTIWPELLKHYVIRRHVGDNPKSDRDVPSKFGIACELVDDSAPTGWEKTLHELGLDHLARLQREARLRSIPPGATALHELICGPYLSLLAGYAIHLVRKFGQDARFGFLSRDSDDLSRIFRTMFPSVAAFNIDLSRRLTRNATLDAFFTSRIDQATVLVDVLSTGRSFFNFAARTGANFRTFTTLLFLERLLNADEKRVADERRQSGKLDYFAVAGSDVPHYPLECLLQSHYPPVSHVVHDTHSGGVIKTFGGQELSQDEQDIILWKSDVVAEFCRAIPRRGMALPTQAQLVPLIEKSLNAIISSAEVPRRFPSFLAREKFNPF